MTEYLHGSHSIFLIHLHIVWVTKYRKKILAGDISLKLRKIIREICTFESIEIMRGHISSDYVHLFISIPPKVAISNLVEKLKERSSHKLMMSFPSLQKQYWGRHMWARGYFCCSSGNVTDEIIKEYIENQTQDDSDDTFKVE